MRAGGLGDRSEVARPMDNGAVSSRIHKALSGAVLVVGLTIGILGRLRVLPLLPLGRWFFLTFAVVAGVEFFWTVLSRSMTRDERGARRFILMLMSIGALVGTSDHHGSIHWGWWLTILAVLWIPQLVPTNRRLLAETSYDKPGPQWRDTLLMALPVALVLAGFGVWGRYEHRVYVTDHAHCPHGLYKLVYPDHTYICTDNKIH